MLLQQQQQEVVTVAQIPASPRRSSRMLQPKMEKLEDDERCVNETCEMVNRNGLQKKDHLRMLISNIR